ncbi:alpha/beta hydrolase [Heyndrickxia sp. NPDC080065]|uniref:alpha/beta hydrolase n=1 Tax=Heyndrickxia sp. NPDC080065 TaxID=3390568 RepID=UPI003D077051
MALIQCDFFSEILDLHTTMHVILPQPNKSKMDELIDNGKRYPTLFLLHGLSDDGTNWLRKTSIERYVQDLGIAVVIPKVDRSFYTDMLYGNRYWTFLTEELPRVARSFFPLSTKREENFVVGLSMGGYGAFKWALHYPDSFSAAASLSGALDIVKWKEDIDQDEKHPLRRTMHLIFGNEDIKGSYHDLIGLLEAHHSHTVKPKLFQCCGSEDFLFDYNMNFMKKCQETNFSLTTDFGPGDHNWSYWDEKIQDVLKWLPIG